MITRIGRWWLSGPKYWLSRLLAGRDWNVPATHALVVDHDMDLLGCETLQQVVNQFRGRFYWKKDRLFQLLDTVSPPKRLLAEGGDDCDGWAMTHAQAINAALGPLGWEAVIISYLAKPWWMSHHFCAVRDPQGKWWAVQPQPELKTLADFPAIPTCFGPYASLEETLDVVARKIYAVEVRWFDVRNDRFEPLTP